MEEKQAVQLVNDVIATAQTPEPEQPTQGAAAADESITKKIEDVQAERLAAKAKDLEQMEARVDKKLAELKRFVDNTEVSGRGLAGSAVNETPEDKAKKESDNAVRGLLAGTGLEKRILG